MITAIWRTKDNSKTPQSSFHEVVEAPRVSSAQLVTIRQSISLGADYFPAGTRLELVSKEDSTIYVRYGNGIYGIPISATDLVPRR